MQCVKVAEVKATSLLEKNPVVLASLSESLFFSVCHLVNYYYQYGMHYDYLFINFFFLFSSVSLKVGAKLDFATFLLAILLLNFVLYLVMYVAMKVCISFSYKHIALYFYFLFH